MAVATVIGEESTLIAAKWYSASHTEATPRASASSTSAKHSAKASCSVMPSRQGNSTNSPKSMHVLLSGCQRLTDRCVTGWYRNRRQSQGRGAVKLVSGGSGKGHPKPLRRRSRGEQGSSSLLTPAHLWYDTAHGKHTRAPAATACGPCQFLSPGRFVP